ncbi:hypothetical protein HG537_0F02690 [Torulaspora globosa]|uniref:Peroxisomal membrane protein PEX25 n=1 Tax=Torulaspora globosa TaxID=48254 RepID=A0A7H9HUU8_9SACH|nr:hypothetical protein HG537_0F02690 [Torulaspora sp. CBS 2947]
MAYPDRGFYSFQLQEEDDYKSNHFAQFGTVSAGSTGFKTASQVMEDSGLQPITVEEKDTNDSDTEVSPPVVVVEVDSKPTRKFNAVRNVDILEYLINSLAGKDKLTKIVKYTLDLLRLLVSNSRANITKWDPSVLTYYRKVLRDLNVRMVLRHPVTISKILLVALFQNFESKANFVAQQLSTYRYILRFGGTPFRVVKMLQKIRDSEWDSVNLQKTWMNESSLRDFLDLYYGICDEMVLLHRLKVWSHDGLYNWFSRHEVLSWQYDILLSLKDNWLKLQSIQKKIIESNIRLQVRTKAMKLSTNLQGAPGYTSPIRKQLLNDLNGNSEWNGSELEMKQKISQLKREKFITYLDLVRLSFDCLANSTDVFNLKTPPGTYAVLSLCSGITGLAKLWINAREQLSKPSEF